MADRVLPYGSWPSPLTPEAAAAGATRFSQCALSTNVRGGLVAWWAEMRPAEAGRTAILRADLGGGHLDDAGTPTPVGPGDLSARSLVNEYGGGAWWVDGEAFFWVDGGDQRIRSRSDGDRNDDRDGDKEAPPLTPDPPVDRGWRYAAGSITPDHRWIVCERELHVDSDGTSLDEPVNDLVAVPTSGGDPVRLVGPGSRGAGDFTAGPVLSPDGTILAWLRWDHPDMPWDAAELWAGRFVRSDDEAAPQVVDARRVAGGVPGGVSAGVPVGSAPGEVPAVSVCLPEWSPDGRLWWCDDARDWWLLNRAPAPGLPDESAGDGVEPVFDAAEEVGEPRWNAGGRRYGFAADGRVVFAAASNGLDSLWVGDPATGTRVALADPGFTYVEHLAVAGDTVVVVGGATHRPTSVWAIDLVTGQTTDLRAADRSTDPEYDPGDVSVPVGITLPTTDDETVHVLFFPPHLSHVSGPEDELPPLVVRIHGGPTGAARAELSTSVQFWTTRGFAVADVNHRGSTGFGRRYRDLLRGRWGEADVVDCRAAARGLADAGLVDGTRCVIRGGSAGGMTTLAALIDDDGEPSPFAAGCSLYGVTDLTALATDTHKFESRYLDGLVGTLPAHDDRYRRRSPLNNAGRLSRPVLMLQGEEDPVVPLSQAEVLLDALAANDVPHAFLLFPGEGHGFRQQDTLVAAMAAELSFYGQVLGFTPAGDVARVEMR